EAWRRIVTPALAPGQLLRSGQVLPYYHLLLLGGGSLTCASVRGCPPTEDLKHLAHPVMRHQPAHMSRDTDVDDSRCAPPADPNPANSGANRPCAVDRPHSI